MLARLLRHQSNGDMNWTSTLCQCFRPCEPPHIQHVVLEELKVAPLPPSLMIDLPPEERQIKVAELLDELDLSNDQKSSILNFAPEKQLQLLYDYQNLLSSVSTRIDRPEAYVAKLEEYASLKAPSDDYQKQSWEKYTEGLKTAMATSSNTFVTEFMSSGGLEALILFLNEMDDLPRETPIHTHIITCVKALMNNSNGRRHILAHPTCLNTISQSLATDNIKTKTIVLEMLGGVCLLPGGHRKVLEAMLHFQNYAGERTRFQTLIVELDSRISAKGTYHDLVSLKIAHMSFINALISLGSGEASLEFRLHLRYEFLMLGIQPVLEKLRNFDNEILDKHLDAFEYYRVEDEREWARHFEEVHIDTKSGSNLFKILQNKLQHSTAYPHFLSLLHHLLLLPPHGLSSVDHWTLFDRILQQISLQREDGEDQDVPAIEINVSSIVKMLVSERQLTEANVKIEKLEKQMSETINDLNEKESQLYNITKEKESQDLILSQLRSQLETEMHVSAERHAHSAQLQAEIDQLKAQLEQAAAGSLSDDVKASLATAKTTETTDSTKTAVIKPPVPPPAPPPFKTAPPPPPPMKVPPPPPPGGGMPPPPMPPPASRPPKQIPKSTTQLRALNWIKINESRVKGTVFANFNESALYKFIDLEDIDKTFDASSSKKAVPEHMQTFGRKQSQKNQQISVLMGNRQQNCDIFLSKLRLSSADLIKVLLNMDSDNVISPDMVEQLVRFSPTSDEREKLELHADELHTLARADRFLYDISKFEHYEERLQCLLFQKKFKEKNTEIEPGIKAVQNSAKHLTSSKRLTKLLEVILAIGNYMNKGARGGAYGFKISSLNRLCDTKATTSKNLNLVHYLVRVCDNQWRDVLNVQDDFPDLKEALRVSISDMEREILSLKKGLDFIDDEINWHRGGHSSAFPPGDRFRIVMSEFCVGAKDKLATMQKNFSDMKEQFKECVTLYGEDPKTTTPEDFFGTFDTFFESFKEARKTLEAIKKKQEEDEKKKKEAEKKDVEKQRRLREKSNQRSSSKTSHGAEGEQGDSSGGENDFDDLVSALRSGEVFTKDIDKMRRKKRKSFGGGERGRDRERVPIS